MAGLSLVTLPDPPLGGHQYCPRTPTTHLISSNPVLPKPPGYRDPAAPPPAALKPPPRRQPLPPAYRQAGGKALYDQRGRRGRGRRGGSSSSSYCCRICCCLVAAALVAAFLIAAVGAVAYLWLQPRFPTFRLQSINATHIRLAGGSLDAGVDVRILALNPNKRIGVDYADGEGLAAIAGSDDDDDVDVGVAAVVGFEQGKRNRTVVRFAVVAKGVTIDDATGTKIAARLRSKEIQFKVQVRSRMGFVVGGRRTGKVPIRVECGPVSLRQGVSGRPLPKCSIYLLRWINLH